VYELSKGNNYQPVIDYSFNEGQGCGPDGNLTFDPQGNLFGTTLSTGSGGTGSGTVYELKNVSGVWQKLLLHTFVGTDGTGPLGSLVTDGAGNWFGTTAFGGTLSWGTVFEISGVH
jgi:hypothetical protein